MVLRRRFYNPNIHPWEEYEKRLETVKRVAAELDFPLEIAPYDPENWFALTEELKEEPEGGVRCPVCFRMRLEKTYQFMREAGLDAFTSTLTVSPQKKADVVNSLGQEIGGDNFLARDFKKKAGFQRSIELARQWGLYHQNYCGCVYSVRQ